MSSLTNRLYDELGEWKYSQLSIGTALDKQNKFHKILDFVLVIIALIGIAGWFQKEDLKIMWTIILITVQAIRLSKNLFLKSSNERFSMKNSYDFYNYHLRDLENLFFDFYDSKYKETNIDNKLRNLQNKERDIFGKQIFVSLNLNNKERLYIETETDNYLKRIKNIIND